MFSNVEKLYFSNIKSFKSRITKFDGKIVECDSFPSPIGTLCKLYCDDSTFVTGEIIGFREKKNLIAIHEQNANLVSGSLIEASQGSSEIGVGNNILGRVIDAFGQPIDDNNELFLNETWPLSGKNINPMKKNRKRIRKFCI